MSVTAERSAPRYRIGAVAHATGIRPETLRVWERRYRALAPTRTPGGGRLYSDADIARLKVIKELLDRGHAISRLADLPEPELTAILARHGAPPPLRFDEVRRQFISAAAALEVEEAERTLLRAALLVDERTLVLEILAPILREVGDRWESGDLRICHEHAASSMIRNIIGALLARRRQPNGQGRATLLTATPAGEMHELGAALMALLGAGRGYRVIFVGASVPVEDLVLGAESTGAAIVGISVVNRPGREVRRELGRLATDLPAEIELVGGGPAAAESERFARRARIFSRLEDFDDWLGERGRAHA